MSTPIYEACRVSLGGATEEEEDTVVVVVAKEVFTSAVGSWNELPEMERGKKFRESFSVSSCLSVKSTPSDRISEDRNLAARRSHC
jgi:hypothetical protein